MKIPRIKKYICPECSGKMEMGFVTTNHSIRWTNNLEQATIAAASAKTLTPGSVFKLKNPKCSGLRCSQCKLVIFKYWDEKK